MRQGDGSLAVVEKNVVPGPPGAYLSRTPRRLLSRTPSNGAHLVATGFANGHVLVSAKGERLFLLNSSPFLLKNLIEL